MVSNIFVVDPSHPDDFFNLTKTYWFSDRLFNLQLNVVSLHILSLKLT